VDSLSVLALNARRLAASRWTGALLVFSTFQWLWTNFVVSFSATTVFILLTVAIPHTRWGRRDAQPDAKDEQGLERLLGMLFWVFVWAFHGIEHRPEQAVWALVSAAIVLLYSLQAFLDWRARVSDDRRRLADSDSPPVLDTPSH
jgi:hypothetical protein